MPAPRTVLTRAAALGTLTALVTLTAGMASAASAAAGMASHATRTPGWPTASRIVYAAHTQTLSANGASRVSVTCPGGALPAGGGTAIQDPRTEQVLQAGFYASAPGRITGYQASVLIHGLRRGSKVEVAVQVACVPVPALVIYGAHTQTLSANGASRASVTCPGGALPIGGGVFLQDPRTEQVLQAGFYASTPGHVAGYQADVRVHGLRRGSKVKVAVQVACVPAPASVTYAVRSQTLSANGTRLPSATCPAGELPVGGGAVVQDPRTEQVLQAGFRSPVPGSVVGYQASVRVHGLRRGSKVEVAVQVACAPAPHLPVYGPLA
jgi:primosomal replication protein N